MCPIIRLIVREAADCVLCAPAQVTSARDAQVCALGAVPDYVFEDATLVTFAGGALGIAAYDWHRSPCEAALLTRIDRDLQL